MHKNEKGNGEMVGVCGGDQMGRERERERGKFMEEERERVKEIIKIQNFEISNYERVSEDPYR